MAAKIAEIPIASDKEIQRLYGFQESLYDELDDYADDIESAVMKGRSKKVCYRARALNLLLLLGCAQANASLLVT